MGDDTSRPHCKYSSDNIMKKIKLKLLENVISFIINATVNINDGELKRGIFKRLEFDLKLLLNSPLKDILLKDISPKYTNPSRNSNIV